MAGREQRVVHAGELLGVLVADDHTGGQRHEIGRLGGVVPRRDAAFGHVRLGQGEGQERDVPVGPIGQPGQDVLVGVAGEGTAIVPRDGEWLHTIFNTESLRSHSPAGPASLP